MNDPIEDKYTRTQYLERIAEAINTYKTRNREDPNILVLSPDDVGLIESAYCELYSKSVCLFSGHISTIKFCGTSLHVAVSWGLTKGQVFVGRAEPA